MADEPQEGQNLEVEPGETNEGQVPDGLSLDDAVKEIAKLRKEAARRRVSNKETTEKLAAYDEWQKSQMSEVDRLKAEKAELEATTHALRKEKWQVTAAEKAGLPAEFAEDVRGDSEEEMTAHAKRLAAKLGKKAPVTTKSPFASRGAGGKPVGQNASEDASTAFNAIMRGDS